MWEEVDQNETKEWGLKNNYELSSGVPQNFGKGLNFPVKNHKIFESF
jgi:hypothetical protein